MCRENADPPSSPIPQPPLLLGSLLAAPWSQVFMRYVHSGTASSLLTPHSSYCQRNTCFNCRLPRLQLRVGLVDGGTTVSNFPYVYAAEDGGPLTGPLAKTNPPETTITKEHQRIARRKVHIPPLHPNLPPMPCCHMWAHLTTAATTHKHGVGFFVMPPPYPLQGLMSPWWRRSVLTWVPPATPPPTAARRRSWKPWKPPTSTWQWAGKYWWCAGQRLNCALGSDGPNSGRAFPLLPQPACHVLSAGWRIHLPALPATTAPHVLLVKFSMLPICVLRRLLLTVATSCCSTGKVTRRHHNPHNLRRSAACPSPLQTRAELPLCIHHTPPPG